MILGSTRPRIWTPPARRLTRSTSYGFEVCDFAKDELALPLDPWQRWLSIHAGELLPDGRPRFKRVLILVARQNGKTLLVVVLSIYWLFKTKVELILGTSTKLPYAAESLRKARQLIRATPDLRAQIPENGGFRKANGQEMIWRADDQEYELETGSRYLVAAANDDAGRSLTIRRLILDELRQHHTYDAHDAAVPTTIAVPDAQVFALSNMGSSRSVVLMDWREEALEAIKNPPPPDEQTIGLFEWSAPEGADPEDERALAQANPNLNRRISGKELVRSGGAAKRIGGRRLVGFRTEHMCQYVPGFDPAIDEQQWLDCPTGSDLGKYRGRVAMVLEVAPDLLHATLYAAARVDETTVRLDVVHAWEGARCTAAVRADLPALIRATRPARLGWFPNGPAAALGSDLAGEGIAWPAETTVEAIRRDVPLVCMGFAELVSTGSVQHGREPLLTAQIGGTEKEYSGQVWFFTRKGGGHCDAVYAAAGAAHLARQLPLPPPKRTARVILPSGH